MGSRVLLILLILFLTGCSSILRRSSTKPIQAVEVGEPPVPDISETVGADTLIISGDSLALSDSLNIITSDSLSVDSAVLVAVGDSMVLANQGIATDSILSSAPVDTIPQKEGPLEAPVIYQANDSILMTAGNWAYMYGESNVKYQQIELQSELIEMNMDSSIVYAKYGLDSVKQEFGYPIFKEGEEQYESKTMRYNFGSKKGYITEVITQQGEGFVTAGRTKKMDDNILNMVGGKYTTCDNHEHPHFYIQMTKAKVRPRKNIVTGPVFLVIEDVPLYPIGLPFCFFPFSSSYSSGILMPTFGDESTRGFFLRDGGYYFALNDYMDLALTGEIYTKGSWGLAARSTYKKRYKYTGSFNASYLVTSLGDKGLPDYSLAKDFKLQWTHSQDAKANPYRTFSASVNFATSSYDRNNQNSFYNSDATQSTKGSTVNITQRFPNNPFTLSATMSVNQRSQDSTLAVTLPDISVTMSRIFPFKRKNAIGDERWYEKISMSYTGYLRNNITTKEDEIFKANIVKDWKNAMQHNIPVSATFSIFKYFNITPNFTYTERWYTNKIEQVYDPKKQSMVAKDTTYGFYRVYDYQTSATLSTTIYGFLKPLPFLGNKVEMIRHRLEPSIGISYRPDFGDSRFGYYQNYIYTGADGKDVEYTYSPYSHNQFSVPGRGQQGMLNFSVSNNVEMKVRSENEKSGFKKISLIDQLTLSTSYNMVADSFNWSDINATLRLKLSKSYTLNLTGVFDTYTYRADANGNPVRVNTTRLKAGKGLGRLRSTGTSFSYTFNNEWFKKTFLGEGKEKKDSKSDGSTPPVLPGTEGLDADFLEDEIEQENLGRIGGTGDSLREKPKNEVGEFDEDGYMVTEIPWSLSFNYSMALSYGTFNAKKLEYNYKVTHRLSFNGNIQPTKNWRLNFNASYDFDTKKISYMNCNVTRDLHCFQLTASFVPVGPYKSYTFSVAVTSSLLRDLKYDKRSNYRDGQRWN